MTKAKLSLSYSGSRLGKT